MTEKHFLIWRSGQGLERIEVFRDPVDAEGAYEEAEASTVWKVDDPDLGLDLRPGQQEVHLFTAPDLATLLKTHPSWVAPETVGAEHG